MSDQLTLLPCPFCGGRAMISGGDGCDGSGYCVRCTSCDAEVGAFWYAGYDCGLSDTAEVAAAEWNRRTEIPERAEDVPEK